MKLANVKVGMKVKVKGQEGSKANGQWYGKIGTITDPDRTESGNYDTDYQIEVKFPCGFIDIMDACDVRKLRGGEV